MTKPKAGATKAGLDVIKSGLFEPRSGGSPLPYSIPIRRGKPTDKELEIERQRELDHAAGADVSVGHGAVRKNASEVRMTKPKRSQEVTPLPILLWCPECGERHIDVGEFATKVHHTHACQHCGHVWRPAICATVGVQFLPGFKNQ